MIIRFLCKNVEFKPYLLSRYIKIGLCMQKSNMHIILCYKKIIKSNY